MVNKKTLILTTLLILFINIIPLPAQIFKSKAAKENKELKLKIDSLISALDSLTVSYNLALSELDSLSNLPVEEDLNVSILDNSENGFLTITDTTANLDSMLTTWYEQKNISFDPQSLISLDSVKLTSNIPDSIYVKRLNEMNSFIPLPYNDIVKNHIIRYTQQIPQTTAQIIGLSFYYMPLFEEVFNKYGLPQELKAMAVIESALNPIAVSRAGAKGMWQFMYTAAKEYGLQITSFVDERLDPLISAEAAAKYLKDSYRVFGDWMLAIASYNCGPGNVNKAIRRSGGSRDFWTIYPYLPRETRGYVPAFIAALYTLKYYPEHNIVPKVVNMPAHIDTFHVNKMLHFEQIAHFTGASVEEIKSLNHQYIHNIIPGNERTYTLRLPYNYTNVFIDNESQMHTYRDSVYFNPVTIKKIKDGGEGGTRIVHRVKKGETLGHIALKYHTSVANIKKWNKLRSNTIRIGQRLYIYKK